jgi:hypothetical protein
VAGDLDRVQLGRARDPFRGGGEAANRPQAVGGNHPPGATGQHDAGRAGEEQDDLEPLECPLHRLHRLGQHQRRPLAGLHCDDPVRLAVERGGAARALRLADRHLDLVVVERQRRLVAAAAEDLAAAHDEDLDAREVQLLRGRRVVSAHRGIGPAQHGLIERALELRPHGDEHERTDGREGDRHGGRGQQGDPHRERRAGRQRLDASVDGADRGSGPALGSGPLGGLGHGGVSRRT